MFTDHHGQNSDIWRFGSTGPTCGMRYSITLKRAGCCLSVSNEWCDKHRDQQSSQLSPGMGLAENKPAPTHHICGRRFPIWPVHRLIEGSGKFYQKRNEWEIDRIVLSKADRLDECCTKRNWTIVLKQRQHSIRRLTARIVVSEAYSHHRSSTMS
jgi:hypothetical protein